MAFMRTGMTTLITAIIAAGVAIIFANQPFDALFHQWQFTVAVAIAGLGLFATAAVALRARDGEERFAALAGLGGGLLCAAMVSAAFSVGPPHALGGSPGQISPLRRGGAVAVRFPAVESAGAGVLNAPQAVELLNGAHPPETLVSGQTRSIGQYVLRVSSGPIAFVRATTPDGRPVTVTQPEGATFISPYLLFPYKQGAQQLDYFAVPPLHRTVNVAYFSSYHDAAKGIDIPEPFVLVQIAEENGAELYRGATIGGRPIRKGGVVLTFQLGTYPDVIVTSAPARLALGAGLAMIAVGLIGFIWLNVRAGRTERRRANAK
ncbi:MAG: hypothetical protein JO194_05745 [Candidatus Eremiobacteraeota bacterium]|nr:hypothetical protein [Candidatus Eremiobacteraeota bacterium]